MALEKKSMKDVPARMRQYFQKAVEMAGKDPEYALLIVLDIVKQEPCFMEARKLLRDLERHKSAKVSFFTDLANKFKIAGKVNKAKGLVRKSPLEALAFAEDALALNINTPAALHVIADAAQQLGAPFIVLEAHQLLCALAPKDINALEQLADACIAAGEGGEALVARQKICALKPGDMNAQQKLRDAAALATLTQSSWQEGGSFRDKVKDSGEAKKLEQESRIVRNADDIAETVADYEKRIAEGDESIDTRRRLAEFYQRSDRHEEAIAALRWISVKTGRMDPMIDKGIEKSEIALLEAQSAAQPELADPIAQQIFDLQLSRAEARVANYPNDLQLRFELAELYWLGEGYDQALEQFQLAQRNPQRRREAMVYIGRIFHLKKQYDMAREQFEKALKEMLIMDEAKMNTLYYLGLLCEDSGDSERARECFRQIYQSNVKYRDVKQRIEGTAQA